MRFGCLLFLLPFLEVALLFQVGGRVGVWPTLGLVLATFLLGAVLAKGGGVRTLAAVRDDLARGRVPTQPLLDGATFLVGAVLLLTPGILTDVAGLGLLLPLTRRWILGWARRRMERAVASGGVRFTVWGSVGSSGWEPGSPGASGAGPDPRPRDLPGDTDRLPPRPGEIIQEWEEEE